MKVLYISYDGMTDPLGQSQVIPYVIGLTKKGYNFTILSYEKPDKFKKFKKYAAKQLIDNSIEWKPFRYHKNFSIAATLYDIFLGFLFLLFFIPLKKVKIMHCRSYISSILGLAFKKLYGTKFIFDMRGFWADERLEGDIFKKNYVYYFFKYLEKQFIKNADAVVALTMNSIKEMASWPYVSEKINSKFYHITTCCDVDKFEQAYKIRLQKKVNTRQLSFIYIGSIGPWHSFRELSDFIKVAYNYLPESRFKIIINSGREQFLNFIKSEGLDSERFIISSVLYNEIPGVLIDMDVGFFFIPPVYAKKSSSPTKLGEMLASGMPVITNHSIGDVDRIVSNNRVGYIIKNFSAEEYKNAINRIIGLMDEDKELLTERCRKTAIEHFSL